MAAIDLILNVACLLLWLNWRSVRFVSVPAPPGISLAGTLKRTEPIRPRRWGSLGALVAILVLRSLFYRQIGAAVSWTPTLELGAVAIPFRSDQLARTFSFSCLGFALWLGGLYACLLLLSGLNDSLPDTDAVHRLIRLQLGVLDRLPPWVKILLPMAAASVLWPFIHLGLVKIGLLPAATSSWQIVRQSLVMGLASVLAWKHLIIGILALHVLNSYVYLGRAALWPFVTATALNLTRPMQTLPLRVGRVDFAPLLALLVVALLAEGLSAWLPRLYARP